ncbi:MAG: VWA domain-containing protein [bacterium]
MNFGNPKALWCLWFIVPLFIYFAWRIYGIVKTYNKFTNVKTRDRIFVTVSPIKTIIKYSLYFLAFVFFVIALARPQGKLLNDEREFSGIDIMVVADVSSSMGALDLKPDRMTVVKDGLKRFADSLSGDRIGMICFAGINFIQCPLTVDYEAFDLIADNIYPGMLAKDGTSIGDAIEYGIKRLLEKGEKSRIMILISDGENMYGENPITAAKAAAKENIRIYTIGVGTLQGGKIPDGYDAWGRPFFKIYNGQEVVTKLDDAELKQVAGLTGAKYYRVTDANAFAGINADIGNMEKNKSKEKQQRRFEENYWYFLIVGLLCFVLSLAVSVNKNRF